MPTFQKTPGQVIPMGREEVVTHGAEGTTKSRSLKVAGRDNASKPSRHGLRAKDQNPHPVCV